MFYLDVTKVDLNVCICFQVFQTFQTFVSSVHLDVVKVDMDVTYVAISKYACCKRMFQCFRHMLQTFFLDVSNVDIGVAHVANDYTCMFQSYLSSVSSVLDIYCICFIGIFQK
jgi:hypothetical protein